MSEIFMGIDISKASFDTAILMSEKIKTKKFSNNKNGFKLMMDWLKTCNIRAENTHVCMEATGIYYESLADFLYQNKFMVSVVNPARIKGFGMGELSRTKNDRADGVPRRPLF